MAQAHDNTPEHVAICVAVVWTMSDQIISSQV